METIFKGLLATLLCSAGIFFLIPLFTTPSSNDTSGTVMASDRMTRPPVQQSIDSSNYQLEIIATDSWQTPSAKARLTQDGSLRWQQDLPHRYGPRFSLVSPTGQVVLFDEYINVASDYAIALFDPQGNLTTQYSFNDIHQNLPNRSRADLTRQAASGWWISAPPTLDATGDYALIKTGGTTLQLSLTTGELTEFQLL